MLNEKLSYPDQIRYYPEDRGMDASKNERGVPADAAEGRVCV